MFLAKVTRSCMLDNEASAALDSKQFFSLVKSVCVATVLISKQGRPFELLFWRFHLPSAL